MPNTVIPSKTISSTPESVTCANCQACCCQLEVRIVTDTGVPFQYIDCDKWGSEVMKRGDDGWCQGLDRNTLMCTIYENRPLTCREFEMASNECITEREIAGI
ncbi:YkgJ family cysteine cluster protein [uncultured Pseudoalteromonas sp.]|uniref:YkgJ family cysteine cluster protein n=1 Tax=uncultured Pseudoalteromonas sp. TaxID=114053 RepID=UPI0030FA2F44